MSTSFRRASRNFSSGDLQRLELILREWSRDPLGRTIALNVRDVEHFLPKRCMRDLLQAILVAPPGRLPESYQEECYRHQRKGGPVRLSPQPRYLGRAVDSELFIKFLFNYHRHYFSNMVCARDFVMRLKSGDLLDPVEEDLLMSEFSAWITWDLHDPASDPFAFLVYDLAVEVRASLGLDQRLTGRLLLLRYHRPGNVALYRPTVADAGLFPYFSPPMTSVREHSFTKPWPPFRIQTRPPRDYAGIPRPEAVHRPVSMKHLTLPVQELP